MRRRSSRWLAVAALLAIGTVAVWRMWSFLGPQPEDPYGVTEWRSMATVYHDVARTGFRAARTGRTNARLARLIERRFDEPVSFRESNDSVGPIGIGFCNTITEKTACLIARVATNESAKETERVGVLVFVDRADASAARALPRGSDLHVFERTIGRLAFYEVSPLDRPHILDRLYSPDRGDP